MGVAVIAGLVEFRVLRDVSRHVVDEFICGLEECLVLAVFVRRHYSRGFCATTRTGPSLCGPGGERVLPSMCLSSFTAEQRHAGASSTHLRSCPGE